MRIEKRGKKDMFCFLCGEEADGLFCSLKHKDEFYKSYKWTREEFAKEK